MKTTITVRGQISIPAELRREMHLTPGQSLVWEKVSQTECRITVPPVTKAKPNPMEALNFAEKHGLETMPTEDWMKILREGEDN